MTEEKPPLTPVVMTEEKPPLTPVVMPTEDVPPTPAPEEKTTEPEPPFSIFSKWEKIFYAYTASLASFASPVSSSIYFPALNLLAQDLHTSQRNINLSITTYMILQGLAPTLVGGFSDRFGRRPAYLFCFITYIGANTGLALQNSFAALLVLRCIQSSGSSGTIALSNGVVSDVATRAERGSYLSLASLGQSLGPAVGPLIGGVLTHYRGWRSIFWFLDVYAGCMLLIILVFLPETCRNIVGNGSVLPQKWNVSLMTYLQRRRQRKHNIQVQYSTVQNKQRPGLFSSIPILFEKEMFLLLFYAGLIFTGLYVTLAGLPSQLTSTYQYNAIQVGLCYIPIGVGSMVSRTVVGHLIDFNFRRHAQLRGIPIVKSRQTEILDFPVERARLEIGLVIVYLGCVAIIPYGWVMNMRHPPLPAVLVLLFFVGFTTMGSYQAMIVLAVDCHPTSSASVSAAGNLVRCLMGAGGVAAVVPLLDRIGSGWTSTLIAAVWVSLSLFWWAVIIWGREWRRERMERETAKRREEEEKSAEKAAFNRADVA